VAGFQVVETAPLTMARTNRLADMYVLSPFVWREGDLYHLLVRAVPRRDDEPRLKMAEIWHGLSDDGLHFEMEAAPTIFPGPDRIDLDGCEDPTVVIADSQMRVWYTGWNQQQETGRLLLARGPDTARLAKAGIALDSRPPFTNPKEATVARIGAGGWRLFFEYADGGASLIGQAEAGDLDGPWRRVIQAALRTRENHFDCWHLSPGPIIETDQGTIMFYNGASRGAEWRIGWASFDPSLSEIVARCEAPLITPQDVEGNNSDIAFAASALVCGDEIELYFAQSDADLRRATIRPA
jgi:predicted GH43/DUF377 family glycosyl hydrolase